MKGLTFILGTLSIKHVNLLSERFFLKLIFTRGSFRWIILLDMDQLKIFMFFKGDNL